MADPPNVTGYDENRNDNDNGNNNDNNSHTTNYNSGVSDNSNSNNDNNASGNGDDNGGHSGNGNDNANNNNEEDGNGHTDNNDNNNNNNSASRDGDVNNNINITGEQDSNADSDPKKNSCSCTKSDFFPEESFQSWSNYGKALKETRSRLKERLFARSSDNNEIHGMRSRSQNQMKRNLNWFDLIWFGVGAVMGAGVFVLTGEAAHDLSGPAVLISYLISGFAALLSVICYTEFAVELPVAGGSFAYLRVELGDFVAFIAAGNILFEYVVAGASVSRSWTSYFATICNYKPNEFRISIPSMGKGFEYWDPMAVVVSVIICFIASFSMKGSSRFNSIATIIHIGVLIFIIVAGSTKANLANFKPFAPFGLRGILKASTVIFFAYVGFDGVATLGEETKKPGRDIPIGLVGSMLIVITTYSLLAAVLCLMQPYHQIDVDAPFTIAFESVGMNWAKLLVGLGALKGMTTVLLATIIAESRYFTHIARTHMAPPILAVVHKKLGTPVYAAVIMTATNCLVAFFTSLDVLASLLSISTLFIFSLVAIGLLVRRYYSTGMTSDQDRNKLIIFLVLIVGSAVMMALLWAWGVNSWLVYLLVVGIWFSATLGIQLKVKQSRSPKLWGAPFVPWLPSGSIALNLFMMGSIDGASFLRFMGWTAVLLTYYFLVGLHASYDASKATVKMEVDDNEVGRGNDGVRVSANSEHVELNSITTSRT